MMDNSNDFATGYALGRDATSGGCGNGNGMFGNDAWWIIILLLFGYNGRGFGGFGGGFGGGSCGSPCATQADVRAAVDQQTLISKIDQQTYGLADSFTALNNTLNNNFRGIDNAICTLGYQALQNTNAMQTQLSGCCCDIQGAIKDVAYGNAMNTSALQSKIDTCCCDLEKMNMQNRFDAQTYNCSTLQAIDKVGDKILDYLANEKTQALRDENFALRLAASQAQQNEALINKLSPCPTPAYFVPNPNCCYNANVTYSNACGCGSF